MFQEIESVLGSCGRLSSSSLERMKYLKACVSEALRLNTVVFATGRRTHQAVKFFYVILFFLGGGGGGTGYVVSGY